LPATTTTKLVGVVSQFAAVFLSAVKLPGFSVCVRGRAAVENLRRRPAAKEAAEKSE